MNGVMNSGFKGASTSTKGASNDTNLSTKAHVPTPRYGQYQMDQIPHVLGQSTESDQKSVLTGQRGMFSNKLSTERG